MGRIIAIDYGQKRVGVAVTDIGQLIAGPLDTIHSKDILAFLKDYIAHEDVECIVVGEPRQMNNEPSESALFVEPFVKSLRKAFPDILVERIDERFTSKMASHAILISGARKKDRRDKALVDKVSAVIMLQSYLEMRSMKR